MLAAKAQKLSTICNRADYMQVMSVTFLNKKSNKRTNYGPLDK